MSSRNTPCSACKSLRKKCTQQCIFAPSFPADKPQLFAYVHRIYGASNVGKILHELRASQRANCVKSLTYEAEARLRDPVYGCVGTIYELQQTLGQLHTYLDGAWKELSAYLSPQFIQELKAKLGNPNTMKAILATQSKPNQFQADVDFPPYGNINVMASHNQLMIQDAEQQELLEDQQLAAAQQQRGLMMTSYEQQQPPLLAAPHNQSVIQDAEQHELLEAQQLAAAQLQRELMIRSFEQQQQQEFMRYGGFEPVDGGGLARLAFGNFDNVNLYQIQRQQQGEQQQHHPDTHVPHSHLHAIEAQQHLDKQGLEDFLSDGGGLARLTLDNFDNISLDQIQQKQQGEQHHHHPHNHVPHSHLHAIDAQQHNDKQGLEDLLGGGGSGPARLALANFDNVCLYQIQQQQQGEQQHHHLHTHVPHSHPHAIETQQLLSPQQHHDKQSPEDLISVFDKEFLDDLLSGFDEGHNP